MMSIGDDAAAEVMKFLSQLEINQLSVAMARITNVSKSAVTSVYQEFIDLMLQETSIGIGAEVVYPRRAGKGAGHGKGRTADRPAAARATISPASRLSSGRTLECSRK